MAVNGNNPSIFPTNYPAALSDQVQAGQFMPLQSIAAASLPTTYPAVAQFIITDNYRPIAQAWFVNSTTAEVHVSIVDGNVDNLVVLPNTTFQIDALTNARMLGYHQYWVRYIGTAPTSGSFYFFYLV